MGLGLGLGLRLGGGGVFGPVLDLNFASSLALPASVTFSRASAGTRFNASGVLESVSTNNPRFGYLYNGSSWVSRGLLIEEQRINLAVRSEDFSNASWSKSGLTVSANSVTAPDGTTTADTLTENTSTSNHETFQSISVTAQTYTFSCFFKAKPGTTRNIALYPITSGGLGNNRYALFGPDGTYISSGGSTGTGPTYTVQQVGDGWVRIAVTATTTGSGTASPLVGLFDGTTVSYLGDGSSGYYLWGAQFATGANPSTYIPNLTTGSTTRSADVGAMTGSSFTDFFHGTEGTIVFEGISPAVGTRALAAFDDNTANESLILSTNGTNAKFDVVDGGVSQASITAGTITANTAFKLAVAYKANDFAASLNGAACVTDTSGTIPSVDRMRLGVDQAGNYLNGFVSRIRYYRTRLTNAQLQGLSA
jgi:hypothetical protein